MKSNKNLLYYLYCALGNKSHEDDEISDKVAFIRLIIFLSYLITNLFIITGVIHNLTKATIEVRCIKSSYLK